jgi:hypothetical protein
VGAYEVRREERVYGVPCLGYPRWLVRRLLESLLVLGLNIFNRKKYMKYWINTFKILGALAEYRRGDDAPAPAFEKRADAAHPA